MSIATRFLKLILACPHNGLPSSRYKEKVNFYVWHGKFSKVQGYAKKGKLQNAMYTMREGFKHLGFKRHKTKPTFVHEARLHGN